MDMSGHLLPRKDLKSKVVEGYTWLRDYITAIKNGRLHPFTLVERKAREATRNEPWGPTGTMLSELAELSHDSEHRQVIFAVLHFRMSQSGPKWRNIYKALQVLEFLIKRGSKESVEQASSEMPIILEALKDKFEYVGEDGRDYGLNVRVRAKAVYGLLMDLEGLEEQRRRLKEKAKAYLGYSRSEMQPQPPESPSVNIMKPEQGIARDGFHAGPQSLMLGKASSGGGKNAGEMKGITFQENKKNLEALKVILSRTENRICADCQDSSAASRPTWASINNGVFICMRCAGIHRGLGVHVSKVRSCTLDTWLPEQVKYMDRLGNQRANACLEARLQPGLRPPRDSSDLDGFIRKKYAREWADGEWPPPEESQHQEGNHLEPTNAVAGEASVAHALSGETSGGITSAPYGFEDHAFGAATQGVSESPPTSGGANIGDLISLEDSEEEEEAQDGFAGLAQLPGVPQGRRSKSVARSQELWDLLDPTMDVMEWVDRQRLVEQQEKGGPVVSAQQPPGANPPSSRADVITTYEFQFGSDDEADFSSYAPTSTPPTSVPGLPPNVAKGTALAHGTPNVLLSGIVNGNVFPGANAAPGGVFAPNVPLPAKSMELASHGSIITTHEYKVNLTGMSLTSGTTGQHHHAAQPGPLRTSLPAAAPRYYNHHSLGGQAPSLSYPYHPPHLTGGPYPGYGGAMHMGTASYMPSSTGMVSGAPARPFSGYISQYTGGLPASWQHTPHAGAPNGYHSPATAQDLTLKSLVELVNSAAYPTTNKWQPTVAGGPQAAVLSRGPAGQPQGLAAGGGAMHSTAVQFNVAPAIGPPGAARAGITPYAPLPSLPGGVR